jgi:hypothetical protein
MGGKTQMLDLNADGLVEYYLVLVAPKSHNWNMYLPKIRFRVKVMVLDTTFNNISIILWWSVLLVAETEVPGENHRPATSH